MLKVTFNREQLVLIVCILLQQWDIGLLADNCSLNLYQFGKWDIGLLADNCSLNLYRIGKWDIGLLADNCLLNCIDWV